MPAGGRGRSFSLFSVFLIAWLSFAARRLPHRGAELRSSSGFDLVLPRLVLLLASFVVLIRLRPLSRVARTLTGKQVASQLALALALAVPYPPISHSLGLGLLPAGGCFMGWQPSNHCQTQRPVALHLGRVVDPICYCMTRLPGALAGLCDSPVRATRPFALRCSSGRAACSLAR